MSNGHTACELCPYGQHVVNEDTSVGIPGIEDGGTCASIASLTAGGCFDGAHCGFLQGYLETKCCSIDASGSSGDVVPSEDCAGVDHTSISSMPGGADDARCYKVDNMGELCVENVFEIFCVASLNGTKCDSCSPGMTLCEGSAEKGIQVDCSSLNPDFTSLSVCADRVSYFTTHGYAKNGGSGGTASVSGVAIGAAVFIVFMRIGMRMARRSSPTTSEASLHTIELSGGSSNTRVDPSYTPVTQML